MKKRNQPGVSEKGALMTMERSLLNCKIVGGERERMKRENGRERDRFFEAQTEFGRIRVLKRHRSENEKKKRNEIIITIIKTFKNKK